MVRPFGGSGEQLRATFNVSGHWPAFEITFESGDGRGRNTDYGAGVEIVLERLGARGTVLNAARISSDKVEKRVSAAGVDPSFTPKGFPLPLQLNGVDNFKLRRAIGNSGGCVDSPLGKSGNTTRRMTLSVTLPGLPITASELELELALAEAASVADEPQAATQTLAMMTDLQGVDAALAHWLAALRQGSRPAVGDLHWMGGEAVMYSASPSVKRPGAFDVKLGVRSSGKPWSVEINAPMAVADANGLASVALDTAGRRFLVRQGWLRANLDSDGEVRGSRFRTLSGLKPVQVTGALGRIPREWYVVAELDHAAAAIRRQTGEFVHACTRARLLSSGSELPPPAPPAFAADEKGGLFLKKAVEAQPEKEVLRLQGEVWLELRRVLERSGHLLVKLRHDAGYEVDGIILTKPSNILLEIKTGLSAADVYEGVGQLLLYSRMLNLANHRRILLLPGRPSNALAAAAEAEGLMIHTYGLTADGSTIQVMFSEPFLATCRGSAVETSEMP